MSIDKDKLFLYAVTGTGDLSKHKPAITLPEAVAAACCGGATMIQFRDKTLSDENFLETALQLREITCSYGIPLIINDRAEIVIHCNADGLHIGQNDISPEDARQIIGNDKILGISARTVAQAKAAANAGADYLGVGDIFGSSSKNNTQRVSYDIMNQICGAVNIPVVAIGGITLERIPSLKGCSIAGIATISAIFSAKDICKATAELKKSLLEIIDIQA